ncbi:hypothetical protein ACROYT_G038144 [Oculina patagonica]
MISLMQYRVAVGLHYTFLKAREISRCVKGQFWSTLLFMFYLEAIYLPALQRQARLWQMNYYVRFWFTQMWLYRFYLPMVIRLANDVETNPGPFFSVDTSKTVKTAHSTSMKVLAFRLSQLGLRPLDVGGAGDCFFRAVSHQLYGTAAYHSQVRAVGIDHLRNHPEHFIESNVEFSWLEYLNNMSRQGTWCDNLIIQAVANALNCTIYIAESAENFAESNVIHPADTHERPGTTIYIGHLDEVHYVSTAPMENEECNFHGQQSQVATPSKLPAVETEERILFNDKTQVCVTKIDSPILQKYSDTPPINDKAEKRRTYIRQYMQKKRADRQFRERENKQKQQKRKENLENSRKNQREALTSYEQVSPEKFKQRDKKTKTRGRESNLEKVRECQRRRFLKYKEANPEKVKERDKKTITKRRQNNLEKVKECKKRGFLKYKEANPEKVKEMDINKKRKRRENNPEKVKECKRRGFNKYKQTNPEKAQLNYTKYKALLQNARESQNVEINIENKCKDPGQNRKRTKDSGNQDQFQQETCKRKTTDEFVQENKKLKCQRSLDQTMTEQIETFHKNIKCGPEYICTCCDQLWYRSSVTKCNPNVYKVCPQNILKISLTGVKSLNNIEWICSTCHSNLKEGKLPSCAKANKMTFPDKPKVLNLTVLEERLVSPRIPFMQIRELPSGGQLSIHGNVVNVPANVNSTVNVLPRPVNESQTIPIKLKRRLRYKHHYQFQNIRPSKVLEAAKYLVQTSQLFQNEGIQVSDGWLKTLNENNEEWSEFLEKPNSKTSNTVEEIYDTDKNQDEENTFVNKNDCNDDSDSDDDWSEERERPSGVMDTLLQEPDMNENGDNIMSFAPAEGNRPLGLFIDRDSEFLSFPTIYCGKRRADNNDRLVPVHYSTICKWELRSQDRRVAQSVPNIFYKLKKLQVKQIQGSASLSLRKCKKKGKKYTAGDLKSAGSLEKLIHLDEGFRVFRNLRASPPFFERCKRDLFAMIRQLGKPTWFCSFSAAETRWTHLLKILGRLVDKRDYTDNEIQDMTWQKKSDLIKSDPVTCARNFEHMVQLFLRDIIKSQLKPIGEVVDFFYRVEFQQRGSPHIHSLFWVKNAPQYGENANNDIVKFVDSYVACKVDSNELGDLVNLQRHRHSRTCKKQGHKICRFNFPLPPMPRTMILEPLYDEKEKCSEKKNYEKISELLDNLKYDEEMNFEEFLQKLGFTEEEYIMALRYSLKRDTLLLKRSPSEIRINNYNSNLLKAWQANMDIQYILDPYACAVYILSYITKGQRGMSKLLRRASEEASSGNKDIMNKVRHIGNKFLNAVEISAQEAVYLVLQMPLRRSSREFQFINTSNPEERTFLLKTMDKLQELPDNSEDIESDNLIKRYQRRPKQMEELCLADFAAWYNCKKQNKSQIEHRSQVETSTSDDCLPENDFDDNVDDDVSDDEKEMCIEIELKGGFKLVKRRKPKIIRSVRFNKNKDPENYSREQLMLYTCWRNEGKDLIENCKTYQERYEQFKNTIAQNRQRYECHTEVLDNALENNDDDELEEFPDVAPNTQHIEKQDREIGAKPSALFGCFDPGTNKQHNQYDLMDDIGIFPRTNDDEDLVLKRMTDDDFRKLVRSLNIKQMEFFYHVLHSIKTSDEALRLFLSGGAGVGKTTVTNALYEALIRYLNSVPGENPDEVRVLKVAPTGKAAFNISGNTLHSAFKIPANRGFQYCTLDRDRLNTIRAQLRRLEVIFIDEISMVGSGMFTFLNLRLQQIMGTEKLFGGVNLITVGDLFQLKPVFDKWIFENSTDSYSALATNIWQEHFKMYELSEIMRQKDDKEFAELLNRLREGKHTEQDVEVLKGRILKVKPTESRDYPVNVTHLFSTNKAVDSHNIEIFNNSKNPKAHISAIDVIIGDLSDELKEKMKQKIPNDPTKTMGLYAVCSVHVAGKYDLTTNISVLDGMTNGAECTIEKIDYRVLDSTRPSVIWVLFHDPHIGRHFRREYAHLYNVQIQSTWTPILEITRQFRIYKRNQVQVLRRQFPLRPAAAKTIHRCQGDTLNEAVVDLPASTREHMHYVGLSRLRNISGLHVLNLNEKKIAVSKKVTDEMTRLRSEASLKPCIPFLYEISNSKSNLKILFQNVRSLHLHIEDVACDYSVRAAHLNIFVESALCSRDNDEAYNMDNFRLYRNDHDPKSNTGTTYGTAMYVRNDIECACNPFRWNYNNTEMTVAIIKFPVCQVHIVGIYRSKSKVVLSKLIEALEHLHQTILTEPQTPVIILGDFNVNLMEPSSEQKAFVRYMIEQKGYTQLVKQYTTDYKTQLDHIYTNIPHKVQSSGTLESYFSDHKPIFVCLNL